MPDTIPNHSKEAAMQIAAMSPQEYALAEKKLLRKLDLKLIPWMMCVPVCTSNSRLKVGQAPVHDVVHRPSQRRDRQARGCVVGAS